MASLIPQNFPPVQDAAIATYDYTDIAEGTGIVTYYGAKNQSSYILTRDSLYTDDTNSSGDGVTSASTTSVQTMTKLFDHDYDLEFNFPKTVKGTAHCNITLGTYSTERRLIKAVWDVQKYDGTTETHLISGASTVENYGSSGVAATIKLISLDVPETHFKKGETLRCTIELWGQATAGVSGTFGYAHDPMNRNDGGSTQIVDDDTDTRLIFKIPFRIDT